MFKHPLARDLAKLIVVKLVALTVLYLAFFAPSRREPIDMSAHLTGSSRTTPTHSTER